MKQSSSPPQDNRRYTTKGQGLVEYGIILALVAVAAIVAVNFFGDGLANTFSTFVGEGDFAPPDIGPLGGDFTPLPPTATPFPTNTPLGPIPTVDPNATSTFTPTPSITPTPSQTPTQTPDPSIPTNTPTPCPYGPHAVPGRIQMEDFACGGQGVGYGDSDTVNTGGQYRLGEGVDIDNTTDSSGNYHVGWTLPGEWLRYNVNISESAVYDLFIRYSSTSSLGRLRYYVDGQPVTGVISLPNTNGYNNWATLTVPNVVLASGSRVIEVRFEREAINYNYMEFAVADTSAPPCFAVNTAVSPANSGTVSLSPASNCAGGLYTQGTQVTFTANPTTGYQFGNWSGGASGTTNPVALTINGATSVTANFQPQCFTVTTNVQPAGAGTITTSPASNCGGAGGYTAGTQVTFTANPATGYTFNNWSGGATGSANPTAVTVNSNTAVVGNFNATTACNPTMPLFTQVNFQESGPPAVPEYLVDAGLAYASRGNGFTYGWTPANTGNTRTRNNNNSPTLLHDTLNHMQQSGTFIWEIGVPNGSYQVCIVAGDPNHTDSSYRIAAEGTLVVNHNPTTANRFGQGFATVTVNDGRLSVTNATGANNNKINFIRIYGNVTTCYPVTTAVGPSGSGTVQRSPNSDPNCPAQQYGSGTQVTFTAVPNSGYSFLNWSGASSSTNSAVTLTINNATTLNANFQQNCVLPSPWNASNIGTNALPGSTCENNGTFRLQASGTGVRDTADGFHYASRQLTGNFRITALVSAPSVCNGNGWANGSLMIRESLNANSRHVSSGVTCGQGLRLLYRDTNGGVSGQSGQVNGTGPVWLRTERVNNTITGYYSTNGVTWNVLGAPRTYGSLPSTLYYGMAGTFVDNNQLTTVNFSNVSVEPMTVLSSGRPTTASSERNGNEANRAVDGDFGTFWRSQQSGNQWWQVDLASVQNLGRIEITFRSNSHNYLVQVSNDGTNYTTVATRSGDAGLQVISLPANTSGRYVRLFNINLASGGGGDRPEIVEVQVFAPAP